MNYIFRSVLPTSTVKLNKGIAFPHKIVTLGMKSKTNRVPVLLLEYKLLLLLA
jgi:hypothetical protein